jgi:hypothetical protein
MGDAQADQVAGCERGARVQPQERVLVVERDDLAGRRKRDGQARVEAGVAAAEAQQGQVRLGPGQHLRPQLHRREQHWRPRYPAPRRTPFGVQPVVVKQVAATAQHHAQVVTGQLAGHDVEPGAAARGHDEAIRVLGQVAYGLRHTAQPSAELGDPAGLIAAVDAALERGHAGQPQHIAARHRLRHLDRLGVRAAACPAVFVPDFNEDGKAWRWGSSTESSDNIFDCLRVVGVAVRLEARVGGHLGGEPCNAGLVDEFVGEQQAREAVAVVGTELADGGHGDRPGAVGELQRGQLGRHRGLAVRRELDIGRRAVGGHGAGVVLQRALAQGQQGVREAGLVQLWSRRGDARGAASAEEAEALLISGDGPGPERLEPFGHASGKPIFLRHYPTLSPGWCRA